MSTIACLATVRGLADFPQVNVRSGPGTHTAVIGTLNVGTSGLKVLEVRPDELKREFGGKIYQWMKLELPDGTTGWVRDDLLAIQGDCTQFGYGCLSEQVSASAITRVERMPPSDDQERTRKAAFNITGGFEGSGYGSYQNYDAGIVSYGRFQFTLASGSLFSVLDRYLISAGGSPIANELRTVFYQRVRDRDPNLREDPRLKELLIMAANEEAMKRAQDEVATDVYWVRVQNLSIQPRNIRTPLGQAFVFDCAIQHGAYHNILGLAEKELGVQPKSKLGENGATEEQLITASARIRCDRLYALADRLNLPGLRVRGDFWKNIVSRADWDLQGDDMGEVETFTGRRVQVRNP